MPGMTTPITVAFTRRASTERSDEMVAWMQAGIRLASGFDGFLGAGWVRPASGSDEWHMLARFDSPDHLRVWDASPQRAWWLGAGEPFAEITKVERRTGIEGWFDPPRTYDVEEISGVASTPPRWKQTLAIFLVFFPVSLAANWAFAPMVGEWPLAARLVVPMLLTVPFMTYLGLPWITRRLDWFLHGGTPPWRRR
jgi:antibiotic biosynthesis monooxygenase (ABM) superfamily enzyme